MSAAETLRGRRVRRNVDEKLLHAIFDVRQILFMADVFCLWHEFTFTSRDGAHAGNYSMWDLDVPCVLEEVFV